MGIVGRLIDKLDWLRIKRENTLKNSRNTVKGTYDIKNIDYNKR
jgi:hypothetical protein